MFRYVDESELTRTIVRSTLKDWEELSNVDVVVVGAGPSGLTAAKYLADAGLRVLIAERRLSFGGGIGGGGNLLHKVLVESPAEEILRDFNIRYEEVSKGLYVVDTAELMAKLAVGAINAGAKVIFGLTVEDVIYRDDVKDKIQITGVVVIWSAIPLAGLHIDPLFIKSKAVIDATGHDAEVLSIVSKRLPEAGITVKGHKPAYLSKGEELVVKATGKVLPGLYVAGMAAASLYNYPRMGPIFGGMLISGKKVAEEVIKDLKGW